MTTPRIDYSAIETHIRRARLQRSAAIGELIADGVVSTWTGLKHAAAWIARQAHLATQTPHDYTTSLPR